MKKKLLFIIFSIFLINILVFSFYKMIKKNNDSFKNIEFLTWLTKTAQKQSSKERIFKSATLLQKVFLDTLNSKLYDPYNFQVDSKKNFYVLDWATQQIKKYDAEGKYLFSFGEGKGKGPKYFSNITDYKIFYTYLRILDPTQGKMEVYNTTSGNFLYSYNFKIPIYKFAMLSDSLLVGKPVVNTQYFLGIFKNQELTAKLLSQFYYSRKTNLISDSHILSSGNDVIVAFTMGGYFFNYDLSKNKMKYIKTTIIPIEFPEVEQPNPYVMKISSKRKFSAINVSLSNNLIILFSEKTSQYFIADFYSVQNGKYQYSIKINKKCTDLQFQNKYVYALINNMVYEYEIR